MILVRAGGRGCNYAAYDVLNGSLSPPLRGLAQRDLRYRLDFIGRMGIDARRLQIGMAERLATSVIGAPLSMACDAWACRNQCAEASGLTFARFAAALIS